MLTRSSRLYVLCLLAALIITGCRRFEHRVEELHREQRQQTERRIGEFLPFGNPSAASLENTDNYLLLKRTFAISYNNSRGTPNWVAWRTTFKDCGEKLPRAAFAPDPDLPFGFEVIRPTDYSGSGYDRGHLLPSADRFGDIDANAETFHMSNVVPQAGHLNQFTWHKLESRARGIVRRGRDVYTIAGVYGYKGRLRGRVTVPTNFWKIMVVLPPGGTIDDVNALTRVIAVDMPNEDGLAQKSWQDYLTTIRAIEQKTGYDFLSALSVDLQEVLEFKIDTTSLPKRDRRRRRSPLAETSRSF